MDITTGIKIYEARKNSWNAPSSYVALLKHQVIFFERKIFLLLKE